MKLVDIDEGIEKICKRCKLLAEEDEESCAEECNWINILKKLPSAEPEPVNSLTKSDIISKQKVRYKLTALVNEIEEIFANIREREVDDCVCGLCEYDGAYIGQSGDWCNECPGFDKDDCFKLKDKYRAEWESLDE